MSDAERARKARRKRKWRKLLDARSAGKPFDQGDLDELIAEFGDDDSDPIDLDTEHQPSLLVAHQHIGRGGTDDLKACPHGCYGFWRDHRRDIERAASQRYRATHIIVPRPEEGADTPTC